MFASRHHALALVLEAERVTAAVVNGHTEPLSAPLAVDPLADDPQVVAAELQDRLRPLGRLPRRALVCLQPDRVMLANVTVPEMAAADLPGYLRLQAEREFLLPPDQMALSWTVTGNRALLAALPTAAYDNLRAALRQLGVKQPEVGVAPVFAAAEESAVLVIGSRAVDLVLRTDGGIVQLRRLAGAAPATQRPGPDLAAVPRELRLTGGALDGHSGRLAIVGSRNHVETLQRLLTGAKTLNGWQLAPQPTDVAPAATMAATAARVFAAGATVPLLLTPPPKPRRRAIWRRLHRRHVAAAIVVLVAMAGGLGWLAWRQQRDLTDLRAQWAALEPRANAIDSIIEEARLHRDWYSDNAATLDLLMAVTEAFPERGTVWAVRLDMKNREQVTLSGRATSRDAWLTMIDTLSANPAVQALAVSQVREEGKPTDPLTFSLSFHWQPNPRQEARK